MDSESAGSAPEPGVADAWETVTAALVSGPGGTGGTGQRSAV